MDKIEMIIEKALSNNIEISIEEIYYLLLSLQEVKSLETPISEDGDSTLADVVGDDGIDMYDSILTKMDCKFLYEDMKKLFSPKE